MMQRCNRHTEYAMHPHSHPQDHTFLVSPFMPSKSPSRSHVFGLSFHALEIPFKIARFRPRLSCLRPLQVQGHAFLVFPFMPSPLCISQSCLDMNPTVRFTLGSTDGSPHPLTDSTYIPLLSPRTLRTAFIEAQARPTAPALLSQSLNAQQQQQQQLVDGQRGVKTQLWSSNTEVQSHPSPPFLCATMRIHQNHAHIYLFQQLFSHSLFCTHVTKYETTTTSTAPVLCRCSVSEAARSPTSHFLEAIHPNPQ
jgi:hypothetical protein